MQQTLHDNAITLHIGCICEANYLYVIFLYYFVLTNNVVSDQSILYIILYCNR